MYFQNCFFSISSKARRFSWNFASVFTPCVKVNILKIYFLRIWFWKLFEQNKKKEQHDKIESNLSIWLKLLLVIVNCNLLCHVTILSYIKFNAWVWHGQILNWWIFSWNISIKLKPILVPLKRSISELVIVFSYGI